MSDIEAGEAPEVTDAEAPIVADVADDSPDNRGDDSARILETVAAAMGWSPKDQWRGPEDQWIPADKFLMETPKVIRELKDTAKRTVKASDRLVEMERAKAVKEANARLEKAREEGDIDEALTAQQDLLEARQINNPQSHVEKFKTDNADWFEVNQEATDLATAAAQVVANRGGGVEEQMKAAEKAVRKAMPELFDADSGNTPSQSTPKAPALVTGGQRAPARPQPKTFAAIPLAIQKEWHRSKMSRDGSVTDADYAKVYWQENAE